MALLTEDTRFEVTPLHIALLERLEFRWDEGYDGSPAVSTKRPYGNSDVLADLREIYAKLNGLEYLDSDEDGRYEFSFKGTDGTLTDAEDLDEVIWTAHKEMELVLLILARNAEAGVQPGIYERSKAYLTDWKRVDPFADYKPEVHYRIVDRAGTGGGVPIAEIAERVYGRYLNTLEANAMDNDGMANDTTVEINLSSDYLYSESLDEFDSKEITLGYDASYKPIVKRGLTQMEYWLSIKTTDKFDEVTHPSGEGVQDLEGATLMGYDGRVPTPGLRIILADLIRRGEIPRGDYLFDHSW